MNLNVKSIIGIAAGKGGVGKSTVTVNLALALKNLGLSVGILDADVYGPSVRKMLPEATLPSQMGQRIVPAESIGIKQISIDYFQKGASIVRAPLANSIISQFLNLVEWGQLDYLLIDFPPGTGDIQLTLMQQGALSAAIIVTTPQEVALLDVRKAVQMFQEMKIPLMGVIENMSYFQLGEVKHFLFGQGGGFKLAQEIDAPFLGEIPIDPTISSSGDAGKSLFDQSPDSLAALAFHNLAIKVCEENWGGIKEIFARQIDQRSPQSLSIEWSDGKLIDYLLADVQKYCPCIRCRDESNERVLNKDVVATKIQTVGRYALKIDFSSGCSQGIYPFALLKGLL